MHDQPPPVTYTTHVNKMHKMCNIRGGFTLGVVGVSKSTAACSMGLIQAMVAVHYTSQESPAGGTSKGCGCGE